MVRLALVLTVSFALIGGCQSSTPNIAAADGRSSASIPTTCESPRHEQQPAATEVVGGVLLTAVFMASLPVVIPLFFCMAATGTLPKC